MMGTTTPSSDKWRRSDLYFFDFLERTGIHQHASCGDWLAAVRAAVGGEFYGLAAFQQENLAAHCA
jgi:hypothetical protein